ncbi:MAG TPA: phosphatidate cytidylyltransferase [Candidatus Acidoferrales bacterium]|nr:phosphatidate cytidylyltransferase [Candidatus Acidoferrales bacterium]
MRVLTALILIPLVVAAIWWGPTWLIAVLAAFVAIGAMLEFFSIVSRQGAPAYRLWSCLAAAGIIGQQLYASRQASIITLGELLDRSPRITLEFVLFGFVLGVAVIALGTRRSVAEVLPSISVSAAGLVFVVLPFSAVIRLHGVDVLGRRLLLFTVVLVWAGDTAAYFVGKGIGRWKMAPQISPNKTWEGAGANFLGALFVAAVFGYWTGIPPAHMLAMGAVGSVAGQLGDLFESAWKRSAGVKDSGTILPGHGGMLDRIDALILAAPAVWYYFEWVIMKKY